MSPLPDPDLERLARKRAGAKLGWYVHALVYLAVNGGMLLAWQLGLRSRPWPLPPMLGWGLGLALHGISVFMLADGSAWRERLVERERERLRRERDRAGGP